MGKRKKEEEQSRSAQLWFVVSIIVGAAACLFLGFLIGQYAIKTLTESWGRVEVQIDEQALQQELSAQLDQTLQVENRKVVDQAASARQPETGAEDEQKHPPSGNKRTDDSSNESGLYRVQVGAFSREDNARRLCEELKGKGYEAIIVKDGLHRVQLGAFSSRANAERLLDDLKQNGYEGLIVR